MKQYEIRTKDLKTAVSLLDDIKPGSEINRFPGCVLVLHTFETDAEADKARLDWLQENCEVVRFGNIKPGTNSLRIFIDYLRSAPQPTIQVIQIPNEPPDHAAQ